MAVERTALAQGRNLEREIRTAHARTFDGINLHDAGADLDRTRFHTFDFGLMAPRRAFAGHETAPAPGERQQHTCTNEVKTYATLHARKNASSFFNEASTLAAGDSVKDKKSLPNRARCLELRYSRHAGSGNGRQGQVYFSSHYQRTHCLCGERGRDFHQYRFSRRLRAALAQGLHDRLARSSRAGVFRNSTRAPRNGIDRTAN